MTRRNSAGEVEDLEDLPVAVEDLEDLAAAIEDLEDLAGAIEDLEDLAGGRLGEAERQKKLARITQD